MAAGYMVDGQRVAISDEMHGQILEVAEWVDGQTELGDVLLCEVELSIGNALFPPEQLRFRELIWGTADIVLMAPGRLTVADAKFGFNEVEAYKNPQLLSYAIGALARYRRTFSAAPLITLAIIQPRCGEPKVETVTAQDVALFANRLHDAALVTLDPNAPLHASPEACHWCPAAAICPENQKLTLAIAREEFPMVPERLTPEQVAEILHKAKAIKQAVVAVEEHALNELQLGRYIPGWKRVAANTKRQWRPTAEKELVAALDLIGVPPALHTEPELKSPAQVEKLLKMKPGALDAYTLKPEGGPVLVPDSDPRPALKADFETVQALPAVEEK